MVHTVSFKCHVSVWMCGFEEHFVWVAPRVSSTLNILQPFSLMKNKKKHKALSSLNSSSTKWAWSDRYRGAHIGNSPSFPLPVLRAPSTCSRTNVSHSQVAITCLEIQHFSVTLDCFVVKFCTCLLLHSWALKIIIMSPCLSSSLGNVTVWGLFSLFFSQKFCSDLKQCDLRPVFKLCVGKLPYI